MGYASKQSETAVNAAVRTAKTVCLPHMLMWKSDVGHVPFVENQPGLEKAITAYQQKYKF